MSDTTPTDAPEIEATEPTVPETERTPTRADIDRLNAENKKHRLAAKAAAEERDRFAAQLKEREDAERTELEKAQAEAAEARGQADAARDRVRQANVLAALADQKHGIVSPQAAAKLIEGVEFDDTDSPTNLGERIEALLEDNSFLKVTAPKHDGTNPANPPKGTEPKEMTADEARQLANTNPNEFARKLEAGEIPASALAV